MQSVLAAWSHWDKTAADSSLNYSASCQDHYPGPYKVCLVWSFKFRVCTFIFPFKVCFLIFRMDLDRMGLCTYLHISNQYYVDKFEKKRKKKKQTVWLVEVIWKLRGSVTLYVVQILGEVNVVFACSLHALSFPPEPSLKTLTRLISHQLDLAQVLHSVCPRALRGVQVKCKERILDCVMEMWPTKYVLDALLFVANFAGVVDSSSCLHCLGKGQECL